MISTIMKISIISFLSLSLQAKQLESFKLPVYPKGEVFEYKAKKKTLINFWASWCTSCIQEIPELEALKKKYPKVEFLAVSAGDSKRKIKKFTKKHGFTYKVLMDKSKAFSKKLGILSLPQTLVIDESGKIIYHENVPPKSL